MLARLLALLDERRLHTVDELAASLGVGPEMVDAMLADLRRRGLLAPPPSTCSAGCADCPLGDSCSRVGPRPGDVSDAPPAGPEAGLQSSPTTSDT